MDISNLVNMANRIGDFFQAMPDRNEALEGIANHISRFWEPRMRRALIAALDSEASAALHALVREAIVQNLDKLTPKP